MSKFELGNFLIEANLDYATSPPADMSPRDLFDKLPEVITIHVKTQSLEHEVLVLPEWRIKAVLRLEITQTNLDLLLERPLAATAPWAPTIEQRDVHWRASRNSVACHFRDSYKEKWRLKCIGVEIKSDMDNGYKQVLVDRAGLTTI